jgi:hypothetical protein
MCPDRSSFDKKVYRSPCIIPESMVETSMRKVIFLFMLSLFVYDVGMDIFDAHSGPETHASACHAGDCQTHAFTPNIASAHPFLIPQKDFVPSEMHFTNRLFDKSLFRPPRPLA